MDFTGLRFIVLILMGVLFVFWLFPYIGKLIGRSPKYFLFGYGRLRKFL